MHLYEKSLSVFVWWSCMCRSLKAYPLGMCPALNLNQPTFPLPGFQVSPRTLRSSSCVNPGGNHRILALTPSCPAAERPLPGLKASTLFWAWICAGPMGRTPGLRVIVLCVVAINLHAGSRLSRLCEAFAGLFDIGGGLTGEAFELVITRSTEYVEPYQVCLFCSGDRVMTVRGNRTSISLWVKVNSVR